MPKNRSNFDGSWDKPNQYPSYCGPAAVASVLGISRDEAARRLQQANPKNGANGKTSYLNSIAKVVGCEVEPVFLKDDERGDSILAGYSSWRTEWQRARPTFARWLREHPRGEYVVRFAHHFAHIRNGKVIEDNGVCARRGRVTHVAVVTPPEAVRSENTGEALFEVLGTVAPKGNIHHCGCCSHIIEGNAASYAHGMGHVRRGEAVRLPEDNSQGYRAAERFRIV